MIKYLFDLIATTLALLLIWPLTVMLALLVRIKFASPILFRQNAPFCGAT